MLLFARVFVRALVAVNRFLLGVAEVLVNISLDCALAILAAVEAIVTANTAIFRQCIDYLAHLPAIIKQYLVANSYPTPLPLDTTYLVARKRLFPEKGDLAEMYWEYALDQKNIWLPILAPKQQEYPDDVKAASKELARQMKRLANLDLSSDRGPQWRARCRTQNQRILNAGYKLAHIHIELRELRKWVGYLEKIWDAGVEHDEFIEAYRAGDMTKYNKLWIPSRY